MDNEPLVSIGVPVYNGKKYIRKALDSLLAQDYQHFELIISDNASTDGTWEICQEYAARDPRIRLYANERNLGGRVNFEIVLNHARGAYFMWAAVDDYWYQTFVSSLVEQLEKYSDAGVAMSAVDLINEDGVATKTVRFDGAGDPNKKNHFQMFLAVCSPVKRKYNFYIYGLFRTELLRGTFPAIPPEINVDRIFVGLIALVTRLRYVDSVLHIRQVRNQIRTRAGAEQLSETGEILKLGEVIWRSPLVPWYRKLYIPAGMLSLSLLIILTRYRIIVRPKLARYWRKFRRYLPFRRGANAN